MGPFSKIAKSAQSLHSTACLSYWSPQSPPPQRRCRRAARTSPRSHPRTGKPDIWKPEQKGVFSFEITKYFCSVLECSFFVFCERKQGAKFCTLCAIVHIQRVKKPECFTKQKLSLKTQEFFAVQDTVEQMLAFSVTHLTFHQWFQVT